MNGRQLSLTLMFLDNLVFGHSMFEIDDSAAFPYKGKKAEFVVAPDSIVPNTSNLARMEIITYVICTTIMVPPHEGQVVGCAPDDLNCNGYVPETNCDMYTVVADDGYGDGDNDAPPSDAGDGGGGEGGNDYCRLFPGTSHNCGQGNPPGWIPITDDNYNPYNANISDSIHITRSIKDSFQCLYHFLKDSLQNGNQIAQLAGLNLFGDSTKMHLTFAISTSYTQQYQPSGQTMPTSLIYTDPNNITNGHMTIEFNPWYMKHATTEYMVQVIAHELMHAVFHLRWEQYQSWLQNHDTIYDSNYIKQHFPIFWYYNAGQPVPLGNISEHEMMALDYVTTIGDIIRPFYNKAASTAIRDTVIKALSYAGLATSSAWKLLPSQGMDTCKYRGMQITAENAAPGDIYPPGCANTYHYHYANDLKMRSSCN